MLSRLREPFGKAGLVVSIVALVTALVGGAYAADHAGRHKEKAQAGLNAKQKSQVQSIAQSLVGTGPAGPQGPAGPKGDNGASGAKGADGTGVTGKTLPIGNLHCVAGGTEFHSSAGTTYACNGEEGVEGPPGEDGDPWAVGGVLPPGETETGTWSIGRLPAEGNIYMPISFPIPLSSEVAVNFMPVGASPTVSCPGGPVEPQAAPGNLCVYEANSFFSPTFEYDENPETGENFEVPAGKTGVVLVFYGEEFSRGFGTWAVTEEEEA